MTQTAVESGLRVYNTMNHRLEPVQCTDPGHVRVYVCGPTVYDVPHAGHARAAVAFDVLVRHLRASGRRVTYVRNLTDIDDKILKRSQETGEAPLALSARMARVYQDDVAAINCVQPDHEPKVSDHLPEVIGLVKSLIDHGAAYVVGEETGSKDVYFSVPSFGDYGKLSHRKTCDLEVGARVAENEVKRDPCDFALWKGATEESYGWDSPWGKGRPGWHIECSAMSERYLGYGFEIHGGGMDLIFPHHENEIAQSEAAHPGQGDFAKLWMHNGFVNVDKEKMSKSLGNFVTIRDVLQRNDPEAFRYFLMTVQYRGPITFDTQKLEDGRVVFPGVDDAERRMDYLYATLEKLEALAGQAADAPPAKAPKELDAFAQVVAGARARVQTALDDDLNTPVALAVIAELAKTANDLCDLAAKRRKDKALVGAAVPLAGKALDALRSCADVLGLLITPREAYCARTRDRRMGLRGLDAAAIDRALQERTDARAAKDFARGDAIRQELLAKGVELADTPTGTVWKVGV
ncbi:MAG TPA: cysteine--tRNA ligase [Polyangiaceae bacterium]|nr:cysteine--tRNA ligase [Polyangiaceae bacterium]